MSTLKTNTIQHLTSGFNNVVAHTDGAGTANAVHCRGWVNFDGTGTVAIRASFNVSSITDNGVGTYTVNLTNALSDTNYSAFCWDVNYGAGWFNANASMTTSTLQMVRVNNSWTPTDNAYTYFGIFR